MTHSVLTSVNCRKSIQQIYILINHDNDNAGINTSQPCVLQHSGILQPRVNSTVHESRHTEAGGQHNFFSHTVGTRPPPLALLTKPLQAVTERSVLGESGHTLGTAEKLPQTGTLGTAKNSELQAMCHTP